MNLRIDEPCHENWSLMTPMEQGRHCEKCCKTVFDFTSLPKEEVIKFISSHEKKSICGKFRADQLLIQDTNHFSEIISWNFKKFLAAIFIVFGGTLFIGCDSLPSGKQIVMDTGVKNIEQIVKLDTTIPKRQEKDTTKVNELLMGKVKCSTKDENEVIHIGEVSVVPETFVGLIEVDESDLDTIK